jgi:long-chain fatty acid transport protein
MKRICLLVCVMVLLCTWVTPLFAGGLINKQNQSAEYIRTLNRNAATDAADIVVYNPAGVMKLENGLYTKLDAMYYHKEYSNTVPGFGEFESDEPSIIPGLFTVYKQERWSAFFAVTIPAGGGKVDFPDGNARTVALANGFIDAYNFNINNSPAGGVTAVFGDFFTGAIDEMELEADSVQLGFTLGGAFKVNEMVSFAAGARYIDAKQTFKGKASLAQNTDIPEPFFSQISALVEPDLEVDLERTATGWGYFLGANVSPTEKLNLGITYFSKVKLDFESDVDKDTSPGAAITNAIGWEDGSEEREDLPGLVGLGASYMVTPQLRVEVNYTLYLENSAELEGDRFERTGNSWDLGVALEYAFTPQWKGSLGYLHTNIKGMPAENKLTEAPELDANTVSAGVVFSATERLQLSFGALRAFYDSEETDEATSRAPADTELEKDVWAVALGIQYRFF